MQRNMVAYKYAKALSASLGNVGLSEICDYYKILSTAFCNARFNEIIHSPFVSKQDKVALIRSFTDMKVDRRALQLLDILADNGRIPLIPHVYSELKRLLELDKNSYIATLYSKEPISESLLSDIRIMLNKKLGVTLDIQQEVDSQIDGIKIEVLDLGVEVSFYKDAFLQKLRDSILKAL